MIKTKGQPVKRLLVLFLATVIALSFCTIVTGAEEQTYVVVYHEIDGVEQPLPRSGKPRFRYFDTITAYVGQTNGLSTSTASAFVHPGYTNTLSIKLQRSKDEESWSDVKSWSTTDKTSEFMVLERQWYINKGYSYQAVSTIFVNTGEHTERATCVSSIIYY